MMGEVRLANVFTNLKMDKNMVDTTKAKEYLATQKEFRSDSSISAPQQLVTDKFGNKIFYLQQDSIGNLYTVDRPDLQPELLTARSNGLQKLVDEIGKNIDLICELEYLIRDIPVRETKHSIHLILLHLRFLIETEMNTENEICLIQKDTPLLAVGCYIDRLKLYDFSYLYATYETAVICNFFTKLCHKAGLNCMKLVIGEYKTSSTSDMTFPSTFNYWAPEVTGVVMEKSDVDSAADIFLNSECHPFPLTRIFVQESIYKDFKDIMTWKCGSQQNTNTSFESNCTDAFKYERKTFLFDFAGNIDEIKNQNYQLVFVEAFRTVNELLALLNKSLNQLCLSIWASGVSESNEIALNVNVPVVWINDYYNFAGPPETSQVVFDKTYATTRILADSAIVERLTQHQKAWNKKTFTERYEKVIQAFESANQDIGNALKEKNKSYWKTNDFVAIQEKTMVMGFNLPIPVVGFYWSHALHHNINHPKILSIWVSIAKALINGSAIGFHTIMGKNGDLIEDIIEMLEKFGIPMAEIKSDDPSKSQHKMTCSYYVESVQTKVIWTSFGTKFAN